MSRRVVIVGAGFVGTQAARLLGKKCSRKSVDVVLVDPKNDFVFTPRLIDALADGSSDKHWMERPLRHLAREHGFSFVQGMVTSIDRASKTVLLRELHEKKREMGYDVLVLCAGAHVASFGIPDAEKYALHIKLPEDVRKCHDRIMSLLTQARDASDDRSRRELLTFSVVGAGPSGIESLFAIKSFVRSWCRTHQKNLLPFTSFSLIQASPQILPGFSLAVINEALRALQLEGVSVYTGDAVKRVEEYAIETALGRRIPSRLTLWSAGIEPTVPPITPPIRLDARGGIEVDAYLRVADDIFAAGDAVTYRERNLVIPKNAQTALLMAKVIVQNVARTLANRPLVPFHYRSKGTILTLGNTGIVDIKHVAIKTKLALFLRDLFYKMRMRDITG